jgi:hypothetical protein
MRFTQLAFMAGVLFLAGCASKPVEPNIAQVDMSASRAVTGSSKRMATEVIFIRDLVTDTVKYRYEVSNRRKLGMDSYIQILQPSYYEIITICTEKNFYQRLAGLIGVEEKEDGTLWARFQTARGNSALFPAQAMNLELMGKEKIVPLNISAINERYCEAVYGEGELNKIPENFASNKEYLSSKKSKKLTLYSYW